jgi:hypothetical protein
MGQCISWFGKKKSFLDKRTAKQFDEQEVLLAPNLTLSSNLQIKTTTNREDDKRKTFVRPGPRSAASQMLGDFLKWFRAITSHIVKPESEEALSSSTLYLFRQTSKIRIFCINVCRSPLYSAAFKLFILAFYLRMTVYHFLEVGLPPYDSFSIIVGCSMYVHVAIQVVAFGLLGHRNSYLLRAPFNSFEFFLTLCFFMPEMYFLQVLQVFRLFSLLENLSFLSSFSAKSKIIRKSLLSLGIFAGIYLLLIFLFSLFSWLVYHSEMNKYCVDPSISDLLSRVVLSDPASDSE